MADKIIGYFSRPTPYWHFWNPMSGWRGGLASGLLIITIVLIVDAVKWK